MEGKLNYKLLNHMCILRYEHGLKDDEYSCYKNYCTKKLFKLRKQLNIKNNPVHTDLNTEKIESILEPAQDIRYFTLLLIQAERSWIYGMLLKSDAAAKNHVKYTDKHRYVKRFAKSAVISKIIYNLSQKYCDTETQTHSMIYHAYHASLFEFERSNYEKAKKGFWLLKNHLDQVTRSIDESNNAAFKLQIDTVQKLIKTCDFYTVGEIKHISTSEIFSQNVEQSTENDFKFHISDDGTINVLYKGAVLVIGSPSLLSQLHQAIQASSENNIITDALLSSLPSDSLGEDVVSEISSYSTEHILKYYQDIIDQLSDSIDSIRKESFTSDPTLQDSYSKLESWPNEIIKFIQIEKNMFFILKSLHDFIKSVNSSTLVTCDDGTHFASIIKQQISLFFEPGYAKWKEYFLVPFEIIRNVNGLCLSMNYASKNKFAEAISLLEWVNGRDHLFINSDLVSHCVPLWRLFILFNVFQNIVKSLANKLYLRTLSIYTLKQLVSKDVNGIDFLNGKLGDGLKVEGNNYDIYNTEQRLLPMKPLLIDSIYLDPQSPAKLGVISTATSSIRNLLSSLW